VSSTTLLSLEVSSSAVSEGRAPKNACRSSCAGGGPGGGGLKNSLAVRQTAHSPQQQQQQCRREWGEKDVYTIHWLLVRCLRLAQVKEERQTLLVKQKREGSGTQTRVRLRHGQSQDDSRTKEQNSSAAATTCADTRASVRLVKFIRVVFPALSISVLWRVGEWGCTGCVVFV
jgi:hypothetical protein